MIDLHLYKSPKDGRTCALVTATTSSDHDAVFYHSGYGVAPDYAFEYAQQLHSVLDQEVIVTGDQSLLDDCSFKHLVHA